MKKHWLSPFQTTLVSGLLACLSLTACGSTALSPAQMAPYSAQMQQMQAMRAPMLQAQSNPSQANAPIQVSFVKAYSRNTAENEAVTRKDPNSPGAMLVRLIDSARQTLDGSFYDIDSALIVEALIRAQRSAACAFADR